VGVFGVLGADRDGSEKLCKPRKKTSVHSRVNHVAKREGRRTEPKPTPATPTRLPKLRTPAPLPFPAHLGWEPERRRRRKRQKDQC
jgi:hypothetical protein